MNNFNCGFNGLNNCGCQTGCQSSCQTGCQVGCGNNWSCGCGCNPCGTGGTCNVGSPCNMGCPRPRPVVMPCQVQTCMQTTTQEQPVIQPIERRHINRCQYVPRVYPMVQDTFYNQC